MKPSSDSSSASSLPRRTILTGLGVTICAAVATVFQWRRDPSVGDAKSPPAGKLPPSRPFPEPLPSENQAEITSAEPAQPFTREWFVRYLKSDFAMKTGGLSSTPVKLVAVSPAKVTGDKANSFTSFSVLFRGPANMVSESKMYHLDHEMLGGMDLLLSPVGRFKDRIEYEAVFSQRM